MRNALRFGSLVLLTLAAACSRSAPAASSKAEDGHGTAVASPVATTSPVANGEEAKDKGAAGAGGRAAAMASAATAPDEMAPLPAATATTATGTLALEGAGPTDIPMGKATRAHGFASGGGPIKAGEWDDNANYREFQRYLGTVTSAIHRVDVRSRRFLVVRDAAGKAVPRCPVTVTDSKQHAITLTTTASGRAILFPFAESMEGHDFTAVARCAEDTTTTHFSLNDDGDGTVDLRLKKARDIGTPAVDLAFILDTTGSMSEEIASVKTTIQKVAQTLGSGQVRVRVGLVEYKDHGDAYVTRVYPMSQNLRAFSAKVAGIEAGGGGDMPEDMEAGLHTALTQLDWNTHAVSRMAFVIGDAPPHLDYPNEVDYAVDMKTAAHHGVQLFTIAASGMNDLGQAVWRQMAQYTGGTEMFVLRGGAGPQSTGGGDPKSSCGGTQEQYASGNLDGLIVSKVKRELAALDADPMRIPGLRTDEDAKPCKDRIALLP